MIRALAASLALLLPAVSFAGGCSVTGDATIAAETSTWHGPCVERIADGSGAVVFYDQDHQKIASFYGTVKQGEPQLGVYELGSGYRIVATGHDESDPETRIDAFRAAQAAALATAKRFEKEHNRDSAAYYTDAARTLSKQID